MNNTIQNDNDFNGFVRHSKRERMSIEGNHWLRIREPAFVRQFGSSDGIKRAQKDRCLAVIINPDKIKYKNNG
ncbi:MAG: hypothetical protein PHY54_00985 [Methylococcales bacterium]|nr:hypothetical protein [Methylococcales bacterium]